MTEVLSPAERLLTSMPLPISKHMYRAIRATVRKDRRRSRFDEILRNMAKQGLSGDYLEFGVYRGSSFVTAYDLAQRHGLKDMRFFAFDSFRGLPCGEGQNWGEGMYSCSRERFLRMIRKAGVDLRKVQAIEGFYEDSLTPEVKQKYGIRRAAFAHLDCDLYSSTAQALAFLTDIVDQGAVLVFDDWACFDESNEHGQRRAFKEWPLAEHFEDLYDTGSWGKGFVCAGQIPRPSIGSVDGKLDAA